jgi:hypothetical protein
VECEEDRKWVEKSKSEGEGEREREWRSGVKTSDGTRTSAEWWVDHGGLSSASLTEVAAN